MTTTTITATELRKLPAEERSAILRVMFAQAAEHLRQEDLIDDATDILEL